MSSILVRAAACLTVACWAAPAIAEPPREVIAWINAHARQIDTADPDHRGSDLDALSAALGDARVIGLGEGTHGTREFYQLKHRVIRWMADNAGLDAVLWESDVVPELRAEAVINDPDAALAGALDLQRGANWNTEEIGALFAWLRAHNAATEAAVRFVGFDIFDVRGATGFALDALRARDAEAAVLAASSLTGALGGDVEAALADEEAFDAAYDVLSLEEMRRYAEAAELTADLLARADAPWEARLAATAAAQRTRHLIQFFTLLPEFGFDAADDTFGAYRAAYDAAAPDAATVSAFAEANDPVLSARLESVLGAVADPRAAARAYREEMSPAERQAWFEAVAFARARLAARREIYLRSAAAEEVDAAAAALDGVQRLLDYFHGFLRVTPERDIVNVREVAMADNVETILAALGAESRAVVSAHNFHVNRAAGPEGGVTSGVLLGDRLGDDYVAVATLFGRGGFQARDLTAETGRRYAGFEVDDPPDDSLEDALIRAEPAVYLLDLRALPDEGPVADWFATPRPMRHIGNQYDPRRPDDFFYTAAAPDQFDVLIFARETERARPTASALAAYDFDVETAE